MAGSGTSTKGTVPQSVYWDPLLYTEDEDIYVLCELTSQCLVTSLLLITLAPHDYHVTPTETETGQEGGSARDRMGSRGSPFHFQKADIKLQ